jgi:hypothetical protein
VLIEWITKSHELPGLRDNALVQHGHIFESILERNPEKARQAMQSHLRTFQRAYTLLGRIVDSSPGHVSAAAFNAGLMDRSPHETKP